MTSYKLVCTQGPKKGSEYLLDGEEVVIGRANENTIAIADTSVSRKHVLLRRGATGWMLKDLGSGNGTILNGERIADEMALRSGDVIRMGDTEVQLVDLDNATRAINLPMPASPSGFPTRARARSSASNPIATLVKPRTKFTPRRVLTVGLGLLSVFILGLVTLRLKLNQDDQAKAAHQREQRQGKIASIFQEGKNLVIQGKWSEAKTRFELVKRQVPEFPAVQDYLDSAEREIPNQKHLQEAAEALEKLQLGSAHRALSLVLPETQMFSQLQNLQQQLEAKVIRRVAEARQQYDQKNFAEVQKITDDVLAASPQNRDATTLNEQARQSLSVRSNRVREPGSTGPKPTEPSIARFRGGDLSGSLALADACASDGNNSCSRIASLIREFASLYKRVEDLDAKNLSRLLSLDSQISGGQPSKMARIAGTRAATMFYKTAAAAKASGQWARASEYARKALQAQPENTGAAAIVADMKLKAKETYYYAYGQRSTNPEEALAKFKEVMQMTLPDDDFYQKSLNWVDKLSK